MSLNCYSPTKRRAASPKKKPSSTKVPEKERPYAALDETQRSHAFRYTIGNNFYREQVDRDNAAKVQRVQTESAHADNPSEKSLPSAPDTSSEPGTTITTFMAQMNQHEFAQRQAKLKHVPEAGDEELPTDRALIESRSEARLLRMMAQRAETPLHDAAMSVGSEDDTPPNVPRQHRAKHQAHQRKVSLPDSIKLSSSKDLRGENGVRRMATKLSFSIPGIKAPASTSTAGDHSSFLVELDIPTKAAKFLGTSTTVNPYSNSAKWTLGLNRHKTQRKRANSTNSLPQTTPELDENDITALPSVFPNGTLAAPDRDVSFEDGTVRIAIDSYNNSRRDACQESNSSLPPTPPAKNTPPHVKAALDALAGRTEGGTSGLGINTTENCAEVSSIDFSEKAPSDEKSQTGWVRHGAGEYVDLVTSSPSLHSMKASFVGSSSRNRCSKEQTPRPDDLRPDGLRWDGLTKEGRLPPTVYKPTDYSPSVYSTLFKSPNLDKRGQHHHSVNAAPALRTVADCSPTRDNSRDPTERIQNRIHPSIDLNDRADFKANPTKPTSSKESLPIVYRLSEGEFVFEDKNSTQVVGTQNLFALPPRISSLGWQKKPPPGARLSLIPSTIRQVLATTEPSMTSSNRIVDPALANMSDNMRDDPQRTSYEGVAERVSTSNNTESATNGANGAHIARNAPHARQSSDHGFQHSVGLTPFLAQQLVDNPNPMSPGFNHPSAMPSPLTAHYPHTIQTNIPTHEQLLTHFHVLHYHIEETFRAFGEVQKITKEDIVGDSEKKFNELRNSIDEYFADVRSHLNAIEHNMGRATGETENLKNALEAHSRSMDDHVSKPMRKLTNQNTEMIKKMESLQERVSQLEKRLENNPPAYGFTDKNAQGPAQNRPTMDAPSASLARHWGGYDTSRHMLSGQQQDRQPYTDVGGRYYNAVDGAPHHNYQDGYYSGAGGSSYNNNYMRRH